MDSTAGVEKIAILGGGIAALSTAFELTNTPDWTSKYDITLYQMGWRLGGKCATGRGENGRIQEHGIHGFLGSYHNTLPMMVQCFKELGRPAGSPMSSFDDAFNPQSAILQWEWIDGGWKQWAMVYPTNKDWPDLPADDWTVGGMLRRVLAAAGHFVERVAEDLTQDILHVLNPMRGMLNALDQRLKVLAKVADARDLIQDVEAVWIHLQGWLVAHLQTDLRRLYMLLDYLFALVRGALVDDVLDKGFDHLDEENFDTWLLRHGIDPITLNSPLTLNTTNLSYQYPNGDTSLPPQMGAGCYLHWTLRMFDFRGAFGFLFKAGTGETIIQPLYEVLLKRGVKFEFFHKVEALRLAEDGKTISAIDIGVQATLKPGLETYSPLTPIGGLQCWPAAPLYDQLMEGAALKAQAIDLESYWTAWTPVARKTLKADEDFDKIVFAISIGAIPHLCPELLTASVAWRDMVAHIPALTTQAAQLWLSRSTKDLGATLPPADAGIIISGTYAGPPDGQVDFTGLIAFEDWPAATKPQSLWYFCGLMPEYEPPPPFTDHDFPARQSERVRYQFIQYLQTNIGPLLPGATTAATRPPGDPAGLDFGLLVDNSGAKGVARFDSQFWRANIDPTERYVASPPGSTKYRLKAWDCGFSNLIPAGDWIYTGLNVGSVEGTVMGGRLASHAVCGSPALKDIIGYPS
ncbi:MAG TPA: NAD(P)-binding protein [Caulobacteraceae bacterium]|jgi:uncharacterized protein with NAD-binding domain and iron-sulfur cluster